LIIDLKRPKVAFLVWIIGVAEIVVHGDSFDDASDGFSAQGSDAGCDKPSFALGRIVVLAASLS
jgi:hypothetical protein